MLEEKQIIGIIYSFKKNLAIVAKTNGSYLNAFHQTYCVQTHIFIRKNLYQTKFNKRLNIGYQSLRACILVKDCNN